LSESEAKQHASGVARAEPALAVVNQRFMARGAFRFMNECPIMDGMAEDRRLARLSKICLALPESSRELMSSHAAFKVRKKIFAYFLNNHHGDGIVAVNCKALPGDNKRLIDADPKRFYMPAYIGPRGWVGLRLDLPDVDWKEVSELVALSYKLVAPKKLASAVKVS
jgi:hypothetical protein